MEWHSLFQLENIDEEGRGNGVHYKIIPNPDIVPTKQKKTLYSTMSTCVTVRYRSIIVHKVAKGK